MNDIYAWVIYRHPNKEIFAILDKNISKDLIKKIAEFIYCTNNNKLTLNEMLSNNILTNESKFKVNPYDECFSVGSESDFVLFELKTISFKQNDYGSWVVDEEKLLKDL